MSLALACLDDPGLFIDEPVEHLDWAVYLDAENPAKTIRRRLHLLAVPPGAYDRLHLYAARGLDLGGAEGEIAIHDMVPREGRGLVVIDSAIATFPRGTGASDNTAVDVRGYVDTIRRGLGARTCACMLLLHTNRQGDPRGSLEWRNATDGTLQLARDPGGVRTLEALERRDGPSDPRPFTFRIIGADDGLRLAACDPGRATPSPGRTRAEVMAGQVADLLADDPSLNVSQLAREMGVARDHGTFRAAMKLAREGGRAGARAVPAGCPGGQGTPPIGGARPAHPAQGAAQPTLAGGEK